LNGLGQIVQECLDKIPSHFPNAEIDAFVVMPNHIHGIIFIYENNPSDADTFDRKGTIYRAPTHTIEQFGKPTVGSLPTIIRTYKAAVTRRAGREFNSANIWQRNYYEHIIRDQVDYERIANYIASNPENWQDDQENPRNIPLKKNWFCPG
jgi:REP element-mobilizing transposase RayT